MTIMNNSTLRELFSYGYVFEPTDEEIIDYLYKKVVGQTDEIDSYTLPEINLYNQQPCEVWRQLEGIDGQDIYLFTQLKKRKSRIIRKVGSNGHTWSGESKATSIFSSDHKQVIGTIKRFHYENSKLKVSDEECSWIMQEYTLHLNSVPIGIVHDSYVVCKLRKKVLKKRKRMEEEYFMYDQVSKRMNRDEALQSEQLQLQISSTRQIESSSHIINQEETMGSYQFCTPESFSKQINDLHPQINSTPQNEPQITNQEEITGSDQFCIADAGPFFKDDLRGVFGNMYGLPSHTTSTKKVGLMDDIKLFLDMN